jgi:IS30 family transposase
LRRNEAPPSQYWPDKAQALYLERRKKEARLDHDSILREFVLLKLSCHGWSPEQISGYLTHRQSEIKSISHESIYSWIYGKTQKSEKYYKYLTRHQKKRGLRKSQNAGVNRIPNRISIHDRPEKINERIEFGHWEGDLMSCQKNSQHILVLRERITMFTKCIRLQRKTKEKTTDAIIDLFKDLPSKARQSITFDNGGEFSGHERIKEDLNDFKTYFCDPYKSWQKGGVENTNGRLRKDFPRHINLHAMSQEDFDESIQNYNSTPRKKLDWQTPDELFTKQINHVALHT